jgi:predicted nucleic acid-binding Zn finger protein
MDSAISKAREIVDSAGVKRHVFEPSGTEIWTVVGSEGEYLVSNEPPLCACPAFYFALARSRKKECHHQLALMLARQQNRFVTIVGHDEEIPVFLGLLWGRQPKPRQSD